MANLEELVSWLDRELRMDEIKDYPGAHNGLQLENSGEVKRIFTAVDASLAVIEEAAKKGGGLLVVHHGMFWQGVKPLTGAYYQKIKIAMDSDLAIYSAHLPLDVHPKYGNNVLLADALGLQNVQPTFVENGFPMAVKGRWNGSLEELRSAAKLATNFEPTVCEAGPEHPTDVIVMTGGAGSQITKVAQAGYTSFVTGEGPQWSYIEAEEQEVNVIYSGHYATETFGVRKIGEVLSAQYELSCSFIERPLGL